MAIRDNQSVPSSRVNKSKKKALVGEDVGECDLQNDGDLVTTTEEVFCFLDFSTLEDGNDRLLRNVGEELPLNASYIPEGHGFLRQFYLS